MNNTISKPINIGTNKARRNCLHAWGLWHLCRVIYPRRRGFVKNKSIELIKKKSMSILKSKYLNNK